MPSTVEKLNSTDTNCPVGRREKEFYEVPFLNPFQRTGTTSFLERMIQCGHPFTMLLLQFRCRGGISHFASQNFYYSMVKDGLANKPINSLVAAMRVFTQEHLNLPKGSIVVLLAVEHSKSFRAPGGNSTSAVTELVNKLLDFKTFRTLDTLRQAPLPSLLCTEHKSMDTLRLCRESERWISYASKLGANIVFPHFPVVVSCTCRRFLSSPSAYNAVIINLLLTTQRTYKPFP
jgi:AAA domain